MTIFAPTIASLYRLIQSYGLDPDAFFKAEGLDPSIAFDSGARVSAGAIDRIAARARESAADPFFGLKEAEYFRPAHLGALGFSWLASHTLRTAVERLGRYSSMVNELFFLQTAENGNAFSLIVDTQSDSMDIISRDDALVATLFRMCQIIHGPGLVPVSVELRHAQPGDTQYYYEIFQCPIHFGCTRNSLNLPVSVIDKRLAGGDEQLAQMNDHIVVKYLAFRDKNDIVNQVKTCILEGIANGNATEQAAAQTLHTSTRNLNRKLDDEGTSFKQLLNETRQELAEQYVHDHTLTLTEISFLLGFSEASSFSRAYKRWTGVSPSQARGN